MKTTARDMLKQLSFIFISFFLLYALNADISPTVKKGVCPTATENMSKKEKRAIKNCIQRNDPNRLEWAILPVIAFDSDVGFIFGGNLAFARFDKDRDLYKWRMELLGSAAVDSSGITMQEHSIQLDIPQILGSNFRLKMKAGYIQVNNKGYYGFGNDSASLADNDKEVYDYGVKSPEAWIYTIYSLPKSMSLLGGVRYRYSLFDYSSTSMLATPSSGPDVLGRENHGELIWALGWNVDERDHETATTSGYFLQLSTRFSIGALTGTDYTYGGTSIQGRGFIPLAKEYLVLAGRVVADIIYGSAPFYEYSIAGAFPYFDMPGGLKGIRGVPEGRYRGPVKLVINLEIRSMFIKFNVASHQFRIGAVAFFDTGRVWMYQKNSELDGTGMGMKFGTGAGIRLQWGETVVIRVDVAYSPDADPVGVYVDFGHMF